jgi:hypothetical protein
MGRKRVVRRVVHRRGKGRGISLPSRRALGEPRVKSQVMPSVDTQAVGGTSKSAGVKIVEVDDTEMQRKVEDEMMRQAGFRKLEVANWFIQKNRLAFVAFCGVRETPPYARVVKETEKAYLLEFPDVETFAKEESVGKLAKEEVISAVKNKKYGTITVWKANRRNTMWVPKAVVKFT